MITGVNISVNNSADVSVNNSADTSMNISVFSSVILGRTRADRSRALSDGCVPHNGRLRGPPAGSGLP
jgi:hypothetical protein